MSDSSKKQKGSLAAIGGVGLVILIFYGTGIVLNLKQIKRENIELELTKKKLQKIREENT